MSFFPSSIPTGINIVILVGLWTAVAENPGIASKIPLVCWIYCLSHFPIAGPMYSVGIKFFRTRRSSSRRSWCRSVGSRQMTLFRGCYAISPLSNVCFSFSGTVSFSLIPRLARNITSSSYYLLGKSLTSSPLITTSAYRCLSRYQCDTGDKLEPIINNNIIRPITCHETCHMSNDYHYIVLHST